METIEVNWGYIRVLEKKMESTIVYWTQVAEPIAGYSEPSGLRQWSEPVATAPEPLVPHGCWRG